MEDNTIKRIEKLAKAMDDLKIKSCVLEFDDSQSPLYFKSAIIGAESDWNKRGMVSFSAPYGGDAAFKGYESYGIFGKTFHVRLNKSQTS